MALITYLVFVALPLLAGRYLAQQERLVSALDRHNRQLLQRRELLAEQARLRERLRIARDMHDSLGHRLSLVSIQAAALEVSDLPQRHRQTVQNLAATARGAMSELYELIGALRDGDEAQARSPGVARVGAVVADFQAAGVPVTVRQRGEPLPLATAAGQAAYRVVEEGLTNATKHAPGQPVTVSLDWEPDALLVTVVNRLERSAITHNATAGRGLVGLDERVQAVDGLLDHGVSDGAFRLVAMLPFEVEAERGLPVESRVRTLALGFATACLMFVVLPAIMLLGAR